MTTEQFAAADAEVLAFEREWTGLRIDGRYDAAILARFGDSPTRHAQRLLAIIDKPEALTYDPQLVGRLRRVRDARAADRARRRELLAGDR